MTNNMNINHIEILPWVPPTVAPNYPTDATVISHLRGEGWIVKDILEFMNATRIAFGGHDRLLTFDQWEDSAIEWISR